MLGVVITFSFFSLAIAYAALQFWAYRIRQPAQSVGNNPAFVAFRRTYLAAYIPAVLGDWLQMPYLYKLYSDYGFQEDQIAVLYVVGFVAAILFGTSTSRLADHCGRRRVAVAMTCVAAVGCVLKSRRSYAVLFVARLVDGAVASFLFATLEAWYVHEHIDKHDFPKEWISVTFDHSSKWSGSLAVFGGVAAYVCTNWFHFGAIAPFLLAIPCFLVSGVIMAIRWDENFGKQQQMSLHQTCDTGLRAITSDVRVLLLGAVQSLYESALYVFIFLWTPVLGVRRHDLGLVFASLMLSSSLGAMAAKKLSRPVTILCVVIMAAVFGYLTAALSAALSFLAFLVIETASGAYFVVMAPLRAKLVAPPMGSALLRVPLGLIAGVALMTLHGGSFHSGNRTLFIVSACMLALAALAAVKLGRVTINDDNDESSEPHGTNVNTSTMVNSV